MHTETKYIETKCVYFLHDRPDTLHWHFPSVVAVVDVENLNKGTASMIDDGQLSEIRSAENRLLSSAIPDYTHSVRPTNDRTIDIGQLPGQLVTINGTIYKMPWDDSVSPKCTLQLIGRLTNVWGYECNEQYMSGITWSVDQIYVESDPNTTMV